MLECVRRGSKKQSESTNFRRTPTAAGILRALDKEKKLIAFTASRRLSPYKSSAFPERPSPSLSSRALSYAFNGALHHRGAQPFAPGRRSSVATTTHTHLMKPLAKTCSGLLAQASGGAKGRPGGVLGLQCCEGENWSLIGRKG